MFPTKFDQNPMTPTEVINWFQLKEHLYTFELPPKTQSPSDLAHIHRVASQHTRRALHQIWTKSIAIRPSYTRLRLKEHLYTFELPPKRNMSPIELIFTGQVAHIVHMSSSKF